MQDEEPLKFKTKKKKKRKGIKKVEGHGDGELRENVYKCVCCIYMQHNIIITKQKLNTFRSCHVT